MAIKDLNLKKAFGIYVDDAEVFIAEAGMGLRGPVLRSYSRQSMADKPLSTLLKEKFGGGLAQAEAAVTSKNKSPLIEMIKGCFNFPTVLQVGVSDTRVYYSGFLSEMEPKKNLDIDAFISENPRAAFLGSPDLAVDCMSATIENKKFLFLGAGKKAKIRDLLKDFYSLELHPIRIEPGPCAALRAAWQILPPAGRESMEIRILCGSGCAWVTLAIGKMPLAWRRIPTTGDGVEGHYAATRALISYAHWRLKSSKGIKQIVLQGDGIKEELATKLSDLLHLPVQSVQGPPCDGKFIAFGLALGALKPDTQTINLGRAFQKPIPLSIIFPRLQAAVACAAILLTLLTMWGRASRMERQVTRLKRENAQAGWAAGKKAHVLERFRTKILDEAEPLGEYLSGRVSWTSLLQALPKILPDNARIVEIRGEDKIWSKDTTDKETGERFLTMRLAAQFPPGGRVPKAIDNYLAAMRSSPFFAKTFPRIQLSGINWRKDAGMEMAYAQVLCLPKRIKKSRWGQKMLELDQRKINRRKKKKS